MRCTTPRLPKMRTMPESGRRTRRGLLPLMLLLAASVVAASAPGCAAGPLERDPLRITATPRGPERSFSSVESAAADALLYCILHASPATRGRLQLGTIHATEEGFSYRLPSRSWSRVTSSLRPPRLRVSLADEDVAVYLVHPRSGDSAIDRANEEPHPSEIRLIEQGARERMLFLLTPSLRIRSYGEEAGVMDLARLVPARAPGREHGRWQYEITLPAAEPLARALAPAAWRAWLAER